jgi:hypothetical protein
LGFNVTYGTVPTGRQKVISTVSDGVWQSAIETGIIRSNLSALSNEYGAKNILKFPY